jgi:hypothetical protein
MFFVIEGTTPPGDSGSFADLAECREPKSLIAEEWRMFSISCSAMPGKEI